MILTIARRELRSLFLSPLAWTILAVVFVILAYFFFIQVEVFMELQPRLTAMPEAPGISEVIIAPVYGDAAIVLLLVVPLLTMRLLSDERRNQTLSLLLSAPITMGDIILGKFFGVVAFLLVLVAVVSLIPLTLLLGGTIDFGVLASCCLGLFLLASAFAALGLYLSSLTAQPTIAAIGSFGVLLLLGLLDWNSNAGVLTYLSLISHYQALLKGVFNSADIIYYLLFSVVFLILSIRRLDAERLQA